MDDERFSELVALAFDGPAPGQAVGWTPWNQDGAVQAVALFAFGGQPELWGHTNLALVLMLLGRTDDAIAHYRTALGLRPDLPGIYANLGMALQSQGRACRKT